MSGRNKYIFILLIFLESCINGFIPGIDNGEYISREVNLAYFDRIHLNGIYDVSFFQDTVCKIIISGSENEIQNVEIRIRNDSVFVDDENNVSLFSGPHERIQLEIYTPAYRSIQVNNPCRLSSHDSIQSSFLELHIKADISECSMLLNCSSFRFWNTKTSAGNFEFAGNVTTAYLGLNHTAHLLADNLKTRKLTLMQSSMGDAHVFATKELIVSIFNKGNVYYYAEPEEVELNDSGAGGALIKSY